jgi:hypothetical protein
LETGNTGLGGTVDTTEDRAALFNAMANDLDAALLAGRRQGMNRALKGIKRMCLAIQGDSEGLIVIISAGLAGCHDTSPVNSVAS